jgi:hypothetical protein
MAANQNGTANPSGGEGSDGTASGCTADLRPMAQGDIILYALMAALTRFIPLFLVDDAAETALMNIMVNKIAAAHQLPLSGKDAGILATATWDVSKTTLTSTLTAQLTSTLTSLASKVLEKATVFFSAKHTVDAFSKNYHVGYLLDYACQEAWVTKHPPVKLRKAIDTTCHGTDMSPFHRAAIAVFEHPGTLLEELEGFLQSQIFGGKDQNQAPDATSGEIPPETRGIAQRLQAALDLMPPQYFVDLRRRLQQELSAYDPHESSGT